MDPQLQNILSAIGAYTLFLVVVAVVILAAFFIVFQLTVARTKEHKIKTAFANVIKKHYATSITRTLMLYPGDRLILFMREPQEKEVTREDLVKLISHDVQVDETTRGRYMITIFSPPNSPFVKFERIPEPPAPESRYRSPVVSLLGINLAAIKIGTLTASYAVKFLHYMIVPTILLVVALPMYMAVIAPQLSRASLPDYASGLAIGSLMTICVFGFTSAALMLAGWLMPVAVWLLSLPFMKKEDREVDLLQKTEWVEIRPRPKRWRLVEA